MPKALDQTWMWWFPPLSSVTVKRVFLIGVVRRGFNIIRAKCNEHDISCCVRCILDIPLPKDLELTWMWSFPPLSSVAVKKVLI